MDPTAITFADIFRWLVGIILAGVGFMAKIFHTRLSDLENKVDGKVDHGHVDKLESMMKEHREETRENFRDIRGSLNTILLKLGERDND